VGPSKRWEYEAFLNVLTKVNRLASGFLSRYSIIFPFSYQGNTRQKSAMVVDTP